MLVIIGKYESQMDTFDDLILEVMNVFKLIMLSANQRACYDINLKVHLSYHAVPA